MTQQPGAHGRSGRWRNWPWGWFALGLAGTTWGGLFLLVLLVFAAVGSPGDGDNALRSVQGWLMLALSSTVSIALACVVASVLSFRLRRQPVGGGVALGLLALLLTLLLVPSLLSRQATVVGAIAVPTAIWQAAGGQG
ncbi:hypothetical protein OK348_16250 [Flavobacterium sp. MXW15]|uniref:Uncharacterized protein n=1 Tax=Xanthomonas chitinilytica TaxID=2989819 RepID=A0ABT3JZY8_9XANT|nr:hypothetical protein [Xanthomonas sp. H13-6]MCW4456337.1 hypothetical protein [Flavobacterium sp. MXW15]MCW4474043.1 hypothetical protein [Xanthomonas sp. H13-6]